MLLERLRRGDRGATALLVQRHNRALWRIARAVPARLHHARRRAGEHRGDRRRARRPACHRQDAAAPGKPGAPPDAGRRARGRVRKCLSLRRSPMRAAGAGRRFQVAPGRCSCAACSKGTGDGGQRTGFVWRTRRDLTPGKGNDDSGPWQRGWTQLGSAVAVNSAGPIFAMQATPSRQGQGATVISPVIVGWKRQ